MAQLAQRLGFDLADTFARDVELLADLFERVVGVHLDPESHAQDLGFTRRQRIEHVFAYVAQGRVDRRIEEASFPLSVRRILARQLRRVLSHR